MDSTAIAKAKSSLRQSLIQRRNIESLSDPEAQANGFTRQLIAACLQFQASTIACYLAFGSEPATEGFLNWALANQLRVMLPVALPDGELHWVYFDGGETTTGMLGFAEANGDVADLGAAELVFVPALAVDVQGNRLGKGKGYYDRALSATNQKTILAVVYDSEVLADVPTDSHDFKVDGFVTESRFVILSN